MMNNTKIKHSIHATIGIGQLLGITNKKQQTINCPMWLSLYGQANHGRVDV
jgi:hypothetical protein